MAIELSENTRLISNVGVILYDHIIIEALFLKIIRIKYYISTRLFASTNFIDKIHQRDPSYFIDKIQHQNGTKFYGTKLKTGLHQI